MITPSEWMEREQALEQELLAKGVSEEDINRSCWYCRDTSQCDETCFDVFHGKKAEK